MPVPEQTLSEYNLSIEKRLEAARDAHRREHADEKDALDMAMEVQNREWKQHDDAHAREHTLHYEKHSAEGEAVKTALNASTMSVKTALDAVANERKIHAEAHGREHVSHERVHVLNEQAVEKAALSVDKRLEGMNQYREQSRADARQFASNETVNAIQVAIDQRFATATKHTDERYEENRRRIETLEKGDVKSEGRSMGQGATVAIIVGAISLSATVLGIIIIISNFIIS